MFGTKKSEFKKRRSVINRKLTCEQLETRAVFDAGDLDLSFGNGGVVTEADVSTTHYDIKSIQRDHKLVVRTEDNALSRYLSDGTTLDTSFGTNGKVTIAWSIPNTDIQVIREASNGKLIVVSRINFNDQLSIVKLNANGTLDTSFGTNGTIVRELVSNPTSQTGYFADVELQPDGKILLAWTTAWNRGSYGNLMRLNQNGTLDTTFGTDSFANLSSTDITEPRKDLNDIAISPDGHVVLVGRSGYGSPGRSTNVFRFSADGVRDNTFHVDGAVSFRKGATDVRGMAIQGNSKIVIALSDTTNSALVRLNTNGTLDNSFSGDGILDISLPTPFAYGILDTPVIQSDNKLLVPVVRRTDWSDSYTSHIFRYDADGTLDTTFADQGILNIGTVTDQNWHLELFSDTDGRLLTNIGTISNDYKATRIDTGSTSIKTKIIKGSTGNIVVNDVYGQDNNLTISRTGNNLVITENTLDPTYRMQTYNLPEATLAPDGKSVTIPMSVIDAAPATMTINTGNGNDKVYLDTDGASSDSIPLRQIKLVLGAGNDTFDLIDNTTDNEWTIDNRERSRSSVRVGGVVGYLGYVYMNGVENFRGGAGADHFKLDRFHSINERLSFHGENDNSINSLSITRNSNMTLDNRLLRATAYFGQQLYDLSYIQTASLRTVGVSSHTLDASAFTLGSVQLFGSQDGPDLLIGSPQADWIDGGCGNDILRGNGGRDILIGGDGADILNQTAVPGTELGEDILIGGYVSNADHANRLAILAAWSGAGTFDERIDLLKNTGVGPNNNKLNASTVIDDNAVDQLFGGSGNDWFFAHTSGTNQDTHDATATELTQLVSI